MSKYETELGTYQLELLDDRVAVDLSAVRRPGQDKGASLIEWLRQQCARPFWYEGEDGTSRHLPIEHKVVGTHTLHGTIESGSTGLFGRLRDGKSGKLLHERGADQADLQLLYFQLFVPPGSTVGVVVFQKTNSRTAYPFFDDVLRRQLAKDFPHLKLRLYPFVAKDMLRKLEDGRVHQIKITQFAPRSDTAAKAMGLAYDPEDIVIETVIKAKRGRSLPPQSVVKHLAQAYRGRTMVEMPEKWKELGDSVTFQVKVGKRVRSMSFGRQREVVPYFDVSEKVKWHNGRPLPEELRREADTLVVDIATELGIIEVS